MAKLLLAISGRVEEGEALSASVFNTATGTSALTGFTLQWQVFNGSTWTNVGAANSLTYTIPAGNSAIGKSYRLVSTPTGANEASASATTAPVVADSKSVHAPTLADVATSLTVAENAAATLLDGAVTFGDADNGNFGGGSLAILNSNSLAAGGDGLDVLSVRNQSAGAGQITYNAATREVFYGGPSGAPVLIGVVDAALTGNGGDLKIAFNANATKAAIDRLIENVQFSNNDDSPTGARLLTVKVIDPNAGSVQRVIQLNVTPSADGPSFTGPAAFTLNENQTAAGVVAAIDPDREAGAAQGIGFSLVAGTGGTDNALFTVDIATGQLSFVSAPDFEGAHGAAYSVRVRASDSNGGIVESVVTVQVQGVNEAPVVQALSATVQEDAAATTLTASFSDPDAGDSHTITLNTAGTVGTVTRQGSNFNYDAGSQFQSLGQGQTATDTFAYTVTDAGGLSSTRSATITIVGSNDAAVVGGTTTSDVHEDENVVNGLLTASGVLSIADIDAGQAHFVAQASATGDLFGGIFSIDANGAWTWQLENDSPVGQVVPGGASYADSFTVTTADGTTQVVSVNVHGANDVAIIAGTTSVSVQEDVGVVNGLIKATGVATIADPDFYEARLVSQLGVTGSGGLGSFNVFEQGTWNYRVDNSLAQVQALGEGQTLMDTLQVTSVDGSASTTLTATIRGSNDGPAITTAAGGNLGEATEAGFVNGGVVQASGTLQATDLDTGDTLTWSGGATGTYGQLEIAAATGQWVYTVNNESPAAQALAQGQTVVETFTATVSDSHGGTAEQQIMVTVHGANDAPVIEAVDAQGTVSEPPRGHLVLDFPYSGMASGAQGGLFLLTGVYDPDAGYQVPAVMALSNEGAPAPAFGTDGLVSLGSGGFSDLAVDVAGRVVVTGFATGTGGVGTNPDFLAVRYNADGTVDNSFGTAGRVTVEIAGSYDYADEVMFDAAGHILLAGRAITVPGSGNFDLTVVRLNENGTLDTSFGTNGRWAFTLPGATTADYKVTLDDAGRMLVWGMDVDPQTGAYEVHVYRYAQDGSLDTDFGDGGKTEVALAGGGVPEAPQLVTGADGALALGWRQGDPLLNMYEVHVARIDGDGAVSGAINTGFVPFLGDFDLAFDNQGQLLVGASVFDADAWRFDAAVARYNADGTLDSAFGSGGVAVTSFPTGHTSAGQIVVQANGDVVVGGSYEYGFGQSVSIVKFSANGNPVADFGEEQPAEPVWGWLPGSDAESGAVLTWSGSADGVYGQFMMDGGVWSYTLDNARAATQALDEGETATDTFTVSLTDEFGAVTTQDVAITIIGSYDPPAP